MHIIPVIDLKDGLVVSAQQGQRESYQPIQSKLCSSQFIEDIINGFLSVHPFKTMYIADLDAIMKSGNNQTLIDKISLQFQTIEFWVDRGATIQQTLSLPKTNYKLIIGSESQNPNNRKGYNASLKNHILSLDFFPKQGYVGPADLLQKSELWPEKVIIMSLNKVGKNAGPDFERLGVFCKKHPKTNFIAAGGIRNIDDLIHLKKIGVHHVLIASSLHSGIIDSDGIQAIKPSVFI